MILARAPMRIVLGGGGTDLPSYYSRYGGFVLSAAIDKYLYIYVNRPAADGLCVSARRRAGRSPFAGEAEDCPARHGGPKGGTR